ncbi:putative alcohol dehydrogenase D [compost metagenome]
MNISAFGGLVLTEKTIRGSLYGSAHVRRDIARLVELYDAGKLQLANLASVIYTLDQVNEAMAHCAMEEGGRAIVKP